MKNFKILFLIGIVFSLSACVSTEADIQRSVYGYSQQDITRTGAVCRSQVNEAAKRREVDRWSKWAVCEKEHKMPLDIEMFNLKQEAIEPVYDRRIKRLRDLEKRYNTLSPADFLAELNKVYDLYDEEKKSKTGVNTCEKWVDSGDGSGSQICAQYPSIF